MIWITIYDMKMKVFCTQISGLTDSAMIGRVLEEDSKYLLINGLAKTI